MNRIDVHCHFLPGIDDGCKDVAESLECLRIMAGGGLLKDFLHASCGVVRVQRSDLR